MSRSIIFFNFFFKNNKTKISIQQLYSIYSIFGGFNNKLTFTQFYIYFTLSKFYLSKTDYSRIYLFLGYLFFLKTFKLLSIKPIGGLGDITSCNNTIQGFSIKNNLSNFWRRFQKLKRPTTDLSYGECYITMYKSKLDKYNKLGFLILFDSFYIVRSRSEIFFRDLVKVNKPLLLTPKYCSSSINKYLNLDLIQNFEFQFLRKNKVYNKGRYSRCRQNYRTGVYMCMYLSVVSIFGLYY